MKKQTKAPAKYPLFNFRADPAIMQALDDMRRDEPDIPTRSEMARRAILRQAEKKGRK